MPLLTLETWLPIARANKDFLEVAEQEAARAPIEKFFRSQNEVKIDGAGWIQSLTGSIFLEWISRTLRCAQRPTGSVPGLHASASS